MLSDQNPRDIACPCRANASEEGTLSGLDPLCADVGRLLMADDTVGVTTRDACLFLGPLANCQLTGWHLARLSAERRIRPSTAVSNDEYDDADSVDTWCFSGYACCAAYELLATQSGGGTLTRNDTDGREEEPPPSRARNQHFGDLDVVLLALLYMQVDLADLCSCSLVCKSWYVCAGCLPHWGFTRAVLVSGATSALPRGAERSTAGEDEDEECVVIPPLQDSFDGRPRDYCVYVSRLQRLHRNAQAERRGDLKRLLRWEPRLVAVESLVPRHRSLARASRLQ